MWNKELILSQKKTNQKFSYSSLLLHLNLEETQANNPDWEITIKETNS